MSEQTVREYNNKILYITMLMMFSKGGQAKHSNNKLPYIYRYAVVMFSIIKFYNF
jgi:hypothetical protein